MLGDEFSKIEDKYELAKVYAMAFDLENLGKISLEIDKFWRGRIMTESDLEFVVENEKAVDLHMQDYVEKCMSDFWIYAFDGSLREMIVDGGHCLEYFYELKRKKILSKDVVNYARNRFEEIGWICKSSLYLSLLENFNDACFCGNLDGIEEYFEKISIFSEGSAIKGPCRQS